MSTFYRAKVKFLKPDIYRGLMERFVREPVIMRFLENRIRGPIQLAKQQTHHSIDLWGHPPESV